MTKKKHVAEMLHKHNRRKVNRFFELLDLPVEAGIELPRITMLGRSDLLLENHDGVLKYTSVCIRAATCEGTFTVNGAKLVILQSAQRRLVIRGEIESIGFGDN